jgi:hypothetical protein
MNPRPNLKIVRAQAAPSAPAVAVRALARLALALARRQAMRQK